MNHPGFPGYEGVITCNTAWANMMIRIVTYGNSTDLQAVLDVQKEIDIKPVKRFGLPTGPALTSKSLQPNDVLTAAAFKQAYQLNSSDVTVLLTLMAELEAFNPPANESDYELVKSTFAAAGIANGKYTPPVGLNLTLASQILAGWISEATTVLSPTGAMEPNFLSLGNSWINLVPGLCGDFSDKIKDGYVYRAFTAFSGYLQLVSSQAIYPENISGGSAGLAIATNQSYILHFSGAPLTAFWSLTLYVDNYLIANPLNRFSLHKESNLTIAADGSFDILIQAADVAPSTNWTSNWLPGPAGGGGFSMNCESNRWPNLEKHANIEIVRNYGPDEGMSDGTYVYPVITSVSAITS